MSNQQSSILFLAGMLPAASLWGMARPSSAAAPDPSLAPTPALTATLTPGCDLSSVG